MEEFQINSDQSVVTDQNNTTIKQTSADIIKSKGNVFFGKIMLWMGLGILVTFLFGYLYPLIILNTVNFDKALTEISRVLKHGGIFVHLDFGDANKHADRVFYELVKFIAELQGDDCYVYLLESKNEFPPVEKLVELFARHGLKYELRRDYLMGITSAQYCIKS